MGKLDFQIRQYCQGSHSSKSKAKAVVCKEGTLLSQTPEFQPPLNLCLMETLQILDYPAFHCSVAKFFQGKNGDLTPLKAFGKLLMYTPPLPF